MAAYVFAPGQALTLEELTAFVVAFFGTVDQAGLDAAVEVAPDLADYFVEDA